ncbi:hypothetical protein [Legionella sp. W05-934-2]|jgi:hypothetical protein|uniref:hypothetical protein n=1 Tax=Legionella sp. W05-934-2 TaxID=1198649 RepID=UPI003462FFF7
MKLFTQKTTINEKDKENQIQFLKNLYSKLSSNPSMPDEQKRQILREAFLSTGLDLDDVLKTISNNYTMSRWSFEEWADKLGPKN